MTFLEPHVFWALLALPVLAAFYIRAERMRRVALDQLLAARLQPKLAGSVSTSRRRTAFVLLLLGLALCITALARPRWGVTFEEQTAVGRDVILAMDTSRSMLAQDLSPNRLDRAKLAALDLLRELEGDKVGLVAFAGDAFLQAPLTPDMQAIEKSIRSLDTESISQGGSNLALAIETAAEAFGKGESDQRALILFSDGEELQEDALEAADKYKDKFRIYTIGVGTAAGAPIVRQTRAGTEYVRDAAGNVVTSKLDESRLQEVAKRAGGFYLRLQNGPTDMRDLAQRGLGTMSEKETGIVKREIPNEWFQWPLVGGIVILMISILLGERRRLARAAVVALLLCIPHPAEAGLGRAISRAFSNSGEEAPAGKPEEPADAVRRLEAARNNRPGVAELEYNVGCAAYSAGDYAKAATAFSTALGSGVPEIQVKAAYNLGNSLARRGVKEEKKEQKIADWTNAIQQYDNALKLQPTNADAKTNRDIVQKALDALKEQEKKQEEQKKEDKQDEKDPKEKEKKDGSQKDQKGDKGEQQKPGEKKQGEKGEDGKEGEKKEGDEKGEEKKDGSSQGPKPGEENPGEGADKSKQPTPKGDPKDAEKNQEVQQGDEKPGEKPKDGQLQQAGDPAADAEAKDDAEAQQAAKEGRMTDKDAKQLLQSMRRHERLMRPQQLVPQRRPTQPGKDW